ncbi:putative vacuolar amino acid transporter YPQ1 [Grifola frondosa]|uniref:Putative vacuolar amino acid transporter YPQ1 n=1 Tax=Grifola frondosa TaxID=5627 RepID=A0A1C7M4E7_GRIFR|nr:putative vacuolar amino acid transporter YPQ1 [Grifola frondosa]
MMHAGGNEALSNVLGWVSIACWLVVYSPQIIENYERKSGEGLSVFFVIIWLIGDFCNLTGALMAGLLPTIIFLGVYYTASEDTGLPSLADEESPLLAGNGHIQEEYDKRSNLKAWAVDDYIHRGVPRSKPAEVIEWRSQLLGWISAVMFLGARVPQIVKNFSTRCEGLSPFLFVYSISGNTTYFLSILAASTEMKHLVANAAWIAGSTLTVFLDIFVLFQFFWYQALERRRTRVA